MLAPWIISHFPSHRIYVEAYGGGASVLLRKDRSYSEVYNDLDGELVNLFRVLRHQGARLVHTLRFTPFARDEFQESYTPCQYPMEQARRTIVRSFMGFGSNAHNRKTGFRSNSNRSGTTPAHDWMNYPDCLEIIVQRLRGVVIENKDAAAIMPQHDSRDTLFYVDPPYPGSTRDKGNDYSHEMTDEEHAELAQVLHGLRGMVILSGYPCRLYDEDLYANWHRVERKAFADGARARTEVLWINEAAWIRKQKEGGKLFT